MGILEFRPLEKKTCARHQSFRGPACLPACLWHGLLRVRIHERACRLRRHLHTLTETATLPASQSKRGGGERHRANAAQQSEPREQHAIRTQSERITVSSRLVVRRRRRRQQQRQDRSPFRLAHSFGGCPVYSLASLRLGVALFTRCGVHIDNRVERTSATKIKTTTTPPARQTASTAVSALFLCQHC